MILSIMVYPAANRALREHPEFYTFMNMLRKRFVPLANFSLAVLIVTGLVQMSLDEQYLGVMDFGNQWSVALLLKHIAILGMLGCSLAIQYSVAPALERTTLLVQRGKSTQANWDMLQRRELVLTW
ncbi:MAG: CopD family protein, partial [Chloroflexota bacterium]